MNLSEKRCESFIVKPEGLPIIEPVIVESWIKSKKQVKNKTKVWRYLGNYWIETLAESFAKAGDSNELSYELARIMIDLISEDKKRFYKFANNIGSDGTGKKAGKKYLGQELEEFVFGLLGPIIYEEVG